METCHYTSELAIYSSVLCGLVKVKVISVISRHSCYHKELTLMVTAKKHPNFKYGEIFNASENYVIPRRCFHHSKKSLFSYYHDEYFWVTDKYDW